MQLSTFTLSFLILCLTYGVQAQVTLTAENYDPPAAYVDSLYFGLTANVIAPVEGPAQVWDYSAVQEDFLRIVQIDDAQGSSFFPDAYSASPGDVKFQVFAAETVFYSGLDASGDFEIGRVVSEAAYPLTALTGNPNDSFRFIQDTIPYEGRINTIQFPMTYPDVINGMQIERTNIELSIAAFGLNNAPVQGQRMVTEMRSVVGYGQVIIPLEDQSPSVPIEVLLMRIDETQVDSFFLGGSPAPPALLSAFGVSQGMVTTSQYYVFYTPNFESTVMTINVDGDNTPTSVIYRPRAADLVSGVREFSPASFSLSPNPVQRGQSIFLQTDQDHLQGEIRLLNLNGQIISQMSIESNANHKVEMNIPAQLPAGMYLLQAYDQAGRLFRAEKVVVN